VASPYQQQSLRRKIVYTALIVGLFCATLVLRQLPRIGMEAQAADLELREMDRGEVELTGSALRLSLSAGRGVAVCALWWGATEKQKKNQWNELELMVRSLTKLQPHFITPWLFQSWNLAYNVSVESDRIKDKYFYIWRGIELLAEGERQNKNNPDLRFSMGFYNQQKLGLSDEALTFRCLFQMSCIDPVKRDPDRFRAKDRNDSQAIDPEKFEQFCRENPMLVRRLRESLKKESPSDIVDFLADHKKIPSRYEDKPITPAGGAEPRSPLKSEDQQFPILPPPDSTGRREGADLDSPDVDNFTAAREWYAYAVEPMPPAEKELSPNPPLFDRRKYRMPRYMAPAIFRGYPSRGQTYVAEYLQREGWFDSDGWKITGGWFPEDKFRSGADAVVGDGKNWGKRAWDRARDRWQRHGIDTGLYLTAEELNILNGRAAKFRQRFNVQPGELPAAANLQQRLDPDVQEALRAHMALYWYEHFRVMTNFPHFYAQSQVEADTNTIAVRKAFFQADQSRKAGDTELAIELYREAFPKWRQILLDNPLFRQDSAQQEDTYEAALKYVDLVVDRRGKRLKELLLLQDYLAHVASTPFGSAVWVPQSYFPRLVPPNVLTPIDQPDSKGEPLISQNNMISVRSRLQLPITLIRPPPEMTMELPSSPPTPPPAPPSGTP
jgi:hypothetical protein